MQDTVECHYLPMTHTQYEQALEELKRAHTAFSHGQRDAG